MISTQNVSLRYGDRALFENVSVKFTEGNCYGIIGANGAGKSTFLKILAGEIEPNKGEVIIEPHKRLSVLKQDHFAYDENKVVETVIMGNKRLYEIMQEKERLYAKEDFNDEDGILLVELEGELAVSSNLDKYFIVRIAWVFGINGKNFIKTMLNVGKKYPQVKVVNDQIGTPTYTYDLARLLVDMAESDKYGYYHATNEGGYISWYDFTVEIFKQAGYTTEVLPVTTEEYGLSKAARPFNSRLDKSKLVENGFKPLPTWQDALSRYLKEIEY